MAVKSITPNQLKELLSASGELAILDAREELSFSRSHLFWAACLPLSRIEVRIADLVPRHNTALCWCDDGEGLAEKAAKRTAELGYGNVMALAGGIAAWRAACYPLYSGVHVPSKAFAEVVEHQEGTPAIDAEELDSKLHSREKLIILDSRSFEEYQKNSIPSAISVPGAELLYRAFDLIPSPDTFVVVNCGGRTRSIIGAQSLINGGLPNKVASLRNGTMAWHLAGFPIVQNQGRRPPNVSAAALVRARAAAEAVRARFGIPLISRQTLRQWRSEADNRSLYLFDVRTPEEYLQGHLPDSISAPGGQLVQETDSYIGTRGARIVLIDEGSAVRASMTASWLYQMGHEVAVLETGIADDTLEVGPRPPRVRGLQQLKDNAVGSITAEELAKRLDAADLQIVDLSLSRSYGEAHIPGSWFAVRARLGTALGQLSQDKELILTSEDGITARFAAHELAPTWPSALRFLEGGTARWRALGLPTEGGLTRLLDKADDIWYAPRDRAENREAAMREYLDWEINLVKQVELDDDCRFRL